MGIVAARLNKRLSEAELDEAMALVRNDPKHGRFFMIKPEKLQARCGSKDLWNVVIGRLRQSGYLISDGRQIATRQVSFPGLGRPRFVCIKEGFIETKD